MPSFRLRCVALGLIIYLQNTVADLCPSEAVDLRSLASRSTLILEGLADGAVRLAGGLYLVRFKVQRLHKGKLGLPPGGGAGPRVAPNNLVSSFVLVGQFGTADGRNSCIPALGRLKVKSPTPYLVFLAAGTPDASVSVNQFEPTNLTTQFLSTISIRDNGMEESAFYYRLSGFPERATDQSRAAVRASAGPRTPAGECVYLRLRYK